MDTFLQLSSERRRSACLQVDEKMHLQAMSVEKDFWVCWTLRALFSMPGIGSHLTFKGGTSLSKAWQLIQRFSEDIDLIIDKEILGFGDDNAPDRAPSKNQRKVRLQSLMDAGRNWVQEVFQPTFAKHLKSALGKSNWKLEVDPDMADGQCLLFHYPSVFREGEAGYIRPVVKIELGARSDDWPHSERFIQPYVAKCFPQLFSDASFPVNVLAAERTFWEKACLLHEETFRPIDKPRKFRMARHYYDLWALLRAGIGISALANESLFLRVVEHRKIFFSYSWVDYSTHRRGTFRLTPFEHQLEVWQHDYKAMLGPMFFGDVPQFDEIMDVVRQFEEEFNRK